MWDWFHRALAQPESSRRGWLDAQDLDPGLRSEVERLIEAAEREQTPLDRSPLRFPDEALQPGQRIGAWAVVRQVASGAMGQVYLVERADGAFERRCALKVLPSADGSGSMAERFALERRVLASLTHPLIASLLDAGATDDGRPWFLMEWVDGQPVTAYCETHRCPLESRLELFVRVCDAVSHAHSKLVAHRDLKPGNILVDGDGRPRLLDFGIARLLDAARLTSPGTPTPLTLGYASPEQIRGESSGIAADVFSLGALLFRLATGEPAYRFDRYDTGHVLERMSVVPDPLRAAPGLPRDLGWIIERALRPDPDRRYRDVASLAADVQALSRRRPPSVAPRAPAYRLVRFAQRNWRALSLAAVAGSTVVALAVGLVLETDRARNAELESRAAREDAEQVADFLARLFEHADRTANAGVELTAGELLARGRDRLDAGAPLETRRRIQLELVLARVYANLGDHRAAASLASGALELARNSGDEEGRIRGLLLLARSHQLAGRDRDALAALAQAAPALGPGAEPAFELAVLRGVSLQRLGRAEQAGAAFDRAMALAGESGRPEWLAEASLRIGSWLWLDGQLEQALTHYRSALAARLRQGSPDAVEVATARDAYASALYALGRMEQARVEFSRAARTRARVLGDAHPDTASSFSHLGAVLYELQRDEAAADALQKSLAIYDRAFAGDSPKMTGALNNYGLVLRRLGRLERAQAMFERALEINRENYGETHRNVATNLNNLGLVAEDADRPSEALAYFQRAEEVLHRIHGADHAALAYAMTNRGRVLLATGRIDAAGTSLRQALSLRRRHLGADHPDTLESLQWQAAWSCLAGNRAEALVEMDRVRALRVERLGPDSPAAGETGLLIDACIGEPAPESALPLTTVGLSAARVAEALRKSAAGNASRNAVARDG